MSSNYFPRLIDAELSANLAANPAIVIEGPRACGKTETALQVAASTLFLDDSSPAAVLARSAPVTALDGETPRLLDEWQAAPGLWNEVRHEVDRRRLPGQFILTGSADPQYRQGQHSGAGRFQRLRMGTMTLLEQGLSTGTASLQEVIAGTQQPGPGSVATVADYAEWICHGGWPGLMGLDVKTAQGRIASYLRDTVERDFPEVAGRRRDPRRMQEFLRAYAGLVAQPASFSAIARRLGESFGVSPRPDAVPGVHDFAAQLYLITDQAPFSPRLRSAAAPMQTPKRHLADPSLAASLLGANPARLLTDLERLGILFESLVVHDFVSYAQSSGLGEVKHLRDSKGRDEIDLVIEAADGTWAGFEVKLSHLAVDDAAENLLRVAAKISPAPAALGVVIPSGPVVRRPDGVWVLPLAACGP